MFFIFPPWFKEAMQAVKSGEAERKRLEFLKQIARAEKPSNDERINRIVEQGRLVAAKARQQQKPYCYNQKIPYQI